MSFSTTKLLHYAYAAIFLTACGESIIVEQLDTTTSDVDTSSLTIADLDVPTMYTFNSKYITDASSVSYSGQVHRHVLIAKIKSQIGGLTSRVDEDSESILTGDVRNELLAYYEFDGDANGDQKNSVNTTPSAKQSTFGDISDKNLKDKFAGNDAKGQHKDFTTKFVGWGDQQSAEKTLLLWFDNLDGLVVDRVANGPASDATANHNAIPAAYISPEGIDYQQLIQKFLHGAIAYSQGTDDYLGYDTDGKGLLADNNAPDSDGTAYSALEHAWDEGFGYFGAARDYADYTDDEIAGSEGRDDYKNSYHDTDEDGTIDLTSEINWGHSVNAAKRDRGSADNAKTDFTKQAFTAFLEGRALLAAIATTPTTDQLTELKERSDTIRLAWENAIAATVVHYINDVLQDMQAASSNDDSYAFADHAKHWSEMKGFALSLQFNNKKQLSDSQFAQLHTLIADAPALNTTTTEYGDYQANLIQARSILGTAYNYSAENLGNDQGENGW